jgi:protein SCO1/2
MKRALITVLLLLLGAYAIVVLFFRPAPAGGDFTLRSTRGAVSLRDLRGSVVLLYFGYVSCPDVCPTSLSLAAKAVSLLDPVEQDRVRLLFVSVDPERDTAENTDRYAVFFDPRFTGLVGTPTEVAAVAKQYGVRYAKAPIPSAIGYAVDHSADIYVIAPTGRLHGVVPHGAAREDLVRAIRAAARERVAP